MIADRVKELSTSTGTGFVVLAGAVTGFESFNTAFGVGPSFDYCIESIDGTTGMPNGAWEIGRGHLSDATTLVRDTVRQSTNADALVVFAAGSKNVFCTLPASVITALQAKLDDAPSDGKTYGRKDAAWIEAAAKAYVDSADVLKEDKANKGAANGYASLDAGAKVPAAQLPSYVDDVLEYASTGAFPTTGTTGVIYVALNTGKIYRWSGSAYIEISPSPGSTDAVPEGSVNLYYTNARASAAAPVQSVASRTGAVTLTKSDVGLANVDNTSDASKPISTATQAGLDGKVSKAGDTMTGNLTIAKSGSGLDSVIWGQSGSVARWGVILGNADAESGGNAGSNFGVACWSDGGSYLSQPLTISRATGNVGIGSLTPGARLTISGAALTRVVLNSTDGNPAFVLQDNGTDKAQFALFAGQTYFDYQGLLNLRSGGGTTTTATLSAAGDLTITGTATKPGGGAWTATSDERIKDVIGDYVHGLAEVLQLLPVRYTFKGNYSKKLDEPSAHQLLADNKREFIGLIAQQAEVPMPEMVTTEAGFVDGKPVADLRVLDTTALTFALVNAVKELAARIEALEGAA
jgi:hypothetical protein